MDAEYWLQKKNGVKKKFCVVDNGDGKKKSICSQTRPSGHQWTLVENKNPKDEGGRLIGLHEDLGRKDQRFWSFVLILRYIIQKKMVHKKILLTIPKKSRIPKWKMEK